MAAEHVEIPVVGMTCARCAANVERTLSKKVPGVHAASVNFANVAWRTTGDGLAMFQGDGEIVLSDGRPYRNHYLMLFEASGGRIVHWWEYYNPVTAMRAFGGPLDAIP